MKFMQSLSKFFKTINISVNAYLFLFLFSFLVQKCNAQSGYSIDTLENMRGLFYDEELNGWYRNIIDSCQKKDSIIYSITMVSEKNTQIYIGVVILITADTNLVGLNIDSNKVLAGKMVNRDKLSLESLSAIKDKIGNKRIGNDNLIYLDNVGNLPNKYFHSCFLLHDYVNNVIFTYYMKSVGTGNIENKLEVLRRTKMFGENYSFFKLLSKQFH